MGRAMISTMTALAAVFAQAAAAKAPPAAARTGVLENVVRCRGLGDDKARLACFDESVRVLDEAETRHEIVVADQEQIESTKRSLFGFAVPVLSIFKGSGRKDGKGGKKEVMGQELQEITTTAKAVGRDQFGALLVTLEDDAQWKQVDQEYVGGRPRAGSKVVIRRAALGSYKLSIDGQIAFRAQRIR